MAEFEEFVAGSADYGAEAEDEEKCDEALGYDTPYHVWLLYERDVHFRLRLVQFTLDDGPGDGVNEGLD